MPVGPKPACQEEGGRRNHDRRDAIQRRRQRGGVIEIRDTGRGRVSRRLAEAGDGRVIHGECYWTLGSVFPVKGGSQ